MYVSVLLDITTPGLRDIRDANVTMLRVLPLEEALHLEYDCDARLLPYYFEGKDICPRFTEEGLQSVRNYNKDRPEAERLNLRISTIFLDIDPGTGDQHVADDAWREDVLEKLRASALWSMGLGLYHTRNGIRGVLCLPEAMKVEDAALWQRSCWSYLQALDVPAESISAWNMAYRAPFVRRDGQDLRLPTERLRQIGVLDLMALRRARIEVGLPADPPPLQREVEHVRLTDDEKITENRNRTLFKVGCKLRHIGMSEKEIYAALLAIDLQRCVPPLQREAGGRREISTAAKSAAKYRAAEVLVEGSAEGLAADLMVADILHEEALTGAAVTFHRSDDRELADWAMKAMAVSRRTMVFDQGLLRKYRDGVWRPLSDGSLLKVFSTLEGARVRKVDRRGQEQLVNFKLYQRDASNMTRWVKGYCEQVDFFSEAPIGCMFRDRFIHVPLEQEGTYTIEEPKPEHRATFRYDFDFIPDPQTPLADAFLELVLKPKVEDKADLAAKVQLFWEFLGCAILGISTRFAVALNFYGGGGNGKSSALEMMQECFPRHQVTHIPPQEMDDDYKMAQLADSRLNLVEEMPSDDIKSSAKFKALVSGSRQQGRHIRQAPFSFIPRAAHAYSMNEWVNYRDLSHGFERRWMILTFEHKISDLLPPEERRDFYGTWIARQEKEHIISKAVLAGIKALRRGGYVEPRSSKQAREGWRQMSDQVSVFLEECCRAVDPDKKEKGTAPNLLYTKYKMWAQATGHGILNRTNFNQRLKTLGYTQSRDGSIGRYWDVILHVDPTSGAKGR